MERVSVAPRRNWQNIVEGFGFTFHKDYWDESAYYQFTGDQIDQIEDAVNELEQMCFEVVNHVIENDLFHQIGIPDSAIDTIVRSWRQQDRNLYGRFDFGCDGQVLKLYEYNADTPTSLFEASVVQWEWLQDRFPTADQFNSIHERLIDAWKEYGIRADKIHFAYFEESAEDTTTALYLADTAYQAGYIVDTLDISAIGSDGVQLFDEQDLPIGALFKLYPWESMWHDHFASTIATSNTQYIEPPWKSILSNKALLPLLWKLFPRHPHLLAASFDPSELKGGVVRKPFFGREGANIALGTVEGGQFTPSAETTGPYGAPFVYQQAFTPLRFSRDGASVEPLIGAWVVASQAAGIGIREDAGITGNASRFVPHLFV